MYKRLFYLLICFVLVLSFSACGSQKNKIKNNTDIPFDAPEELMTTEEYHTEIEELLAQNNFTVANDEYLKQIDNLGDRLKDSIVYSTNDITECTGTKYYISNYGSDENDGKTPKTAWASLEKLNDAKLSKGDLVLFERGSMWRGTVMVISGVTYSAYGSGHKPEIRSSFDGMEGEWVETDSENIWTYQMDKIIEDVGTLVFNFKDENTTYAEKVYRPDQIKKGYFAYCGRGNGKIKGQEIDNKIYLYCEGNPKDVYSGIEISVRADPIEFKGSAANITLNNLALSFGGNPYFASNTVQINNVTMSYCVSSWHGGVYENGETRLGGGAGCWQSCDNLVYDHCYFYQQFDSGVTPQGGGSPKDVTVMKDFITKDCLFEYCEYTLEYFNSQDNSLENRYENLYFGYNFCRFGGHGFGDKPDKSFYVKSWDAENTCYNSSIEYNIFDRPFKANIQVNSFEQTADGNKLSYEYLPKFRNNVYIHKKNRVHGEVNKVDYKFNEESYNKLNSLGFDVGSRFIFVK